MLSCEENAGLKVYAKAEVSMHDYVFFEGSSDTIEIKVGNNTLNLKLKFVEPDYSDNNEYSLTTQTALYEKSTYQAPEEY